MSKKGYSLTNFYISTKIQSSLRNCLLKSVLFTYEERGEEGGEGEGIKWNGRIVPGVQENVTDTRSHKNGRSGILLAKFRSSH